MLSLFLQPPEEGEEEKLGPDGETKIAMDQYYMDEYDQYAEGKRNSFDILTIFEYFLFNTCWFSEEDYRQFFLFGFSRILICTA